MANNYQKERSAFIYHRENQIIGSIVRTLNDALSGIAPGWRVMRANQPTVQALENKTVYFDIVSKRKYGTVGRQAYKDAQGWYGGAKWYEEWLIQVSGFQQRTPETDTTETLTSVDVITLLQARINGSVGGLLHNELGKISYTKNIFGVPWLDVIASSVLREIDFETDSGLKEKLPQFDFTIVIEQGQVSPVIEADLIDMRVSSV